ncbi:MAG: class I SAM-dependent methyltransferase [Phycisphaerae bacterium]|nr:class I SAM-dependent methyltransferase [Phycisphaerae bacterium]
MSVQVVHTPRVEEWRRLYEVAASAASWVAAHRWSYDETIARLTVADIRRKLDLSLRDRLLEIGCGTGASLSLVLHEDQLGYGFDLCEAQIRRAGDFAVDRARLRLGVAEAGALPVASGRFDKVLCYSVFQCLPDDDYARRVVAELIRACRPGGLILIGDVFGVMERQRQRLIGHGHNERVVDAFLSPLLPMWHARHRLQASNNRVKPRHYRRGFFRGALHEIACDVSFLPQRIPGRSASRCRYDVLIRRHG